MRIADDRRGLDLIEQALHDRPDALLGGPRASRSERARGTHEVEQVGALGVVELEGARRRFTAERAELGNTAEY